MNLYIWAIVTLAGLLGLAGMSRVRRRGPVSWD